MSDNVHQHPGTRGTAGTPASFVNSELFHRQSVRFRSIHSTNSPNGVKTSERAKKYLRTWQMETRVPVPAVKERLWV